MSAAAGGDMNKVFEFIDDASQQTNGEVVGREEFDAIRCFWSKLCQGLDRTNSASSLLDQLGRILQMSTGVKNIVDAPMQVCH